MKRVISIVLILVLMFSLCSFGVSAAPEDQKQIKILAIGHSYSNNATQYINSIAYSMGLNVSVTSLYDDGCPIERHVKWYNTKANEYQFYVDGVNISKSGKQTMQEVFELADYDYVTIQQSSSGAANFSTFWTEEKPWLTELYKIIKKHEPQAEIMIHQTWGFSEEVATSGNDYTNISYPNSKVMYEKIVNAYEQAADMLSIDKEKGIIPAGKAIQLAKDEYGYGDFYNTGEKLTSWQQCENGALYADSICHLNNRGRYLVGCVWLEYILGVDCRKADFYPAELFRDESKILRDIAHEAVTGEKQYVEGDWRYLPAENNTVELVHYMGAVPSNGVIEVPTTLGGKTVSVVDDTAFKYIDGIKKVVLPNADIKYEDGTFKAGFSVDDNRGSDTSSAKKKKKNPNAKDEALDPVLIVVIVCSVLAVIAAAVILLVFKKKRTNK